MLETQFITDETSLKFNLYSLKIRGTHGDFFKCRLAVFYIDFKSGQHDYNHAWNIKRACWVEVEIFWE